MKLRIVDARAFYAGMVFTAIGTAAFIMSHQYSMGSLFDMGPGFFPAIVSGLLALLGLASIFQGIRATVPNPVADCRGLPLLMVLAGVVSFGLLIVRAGLLVAMAALIGLSCFDRLRSRPLEVAVIYLVLAGFSVGTFVYAFGMPINLFWWQ